MTFKIHYIAEYRLVHGKGLNRGEVGGFTSLRSFDSLEEATRYIGKYKIRADIPRRDIRDDETYHLSPPKIWEMTPRGSKGMAKLMAQSGLKMCHSEWRHTDGDIYEIKVDFFNLKSRLMECSSITFKTLEEAFDNLRFKDTKTRLLSDWRLYSKRLVKLK